MEPFKNKEFENLHERFKLEIRLQGKSPKTIDSYARSLRRLFQYFDCHPDELTEDDLKLYFHDLLSARSWSPVRVDRWGLRLFWKRVLKKDWDFPDIVRGPKEKKLPDILSVEEVDKVMGALDKFRYRACLFTIYSMGLRLSEGTGLKVSDIDSARGQIHVRSAKGNKDRMVPLPKQTLNILRRYWATHLVEAGVNLRAIQEYLGHANPNTTVIYAKLSKPTADNSSQLIQDLMDRFQFVKRKNVYLPDGN